MRQPVAALFVVSWLGTSAGCSLIYNPSNLSEPRADAAPDAELILDADPTMLELTRVSPAIVEEGRGADGSRRAVIVVHGKQLVAGAKISLTLHGTTTPYGTVDDAATEVADNGFMVAAPVVFPVDDALDTDFTRLDVTVTQPAGGTTTTRMLDAYDNDAPVLRVQHLDELTTTMIAAGSHVFSRVAIPAGGLAVTTTTAPLVIRSVSSISITGIVQVSSFGKAAGPGGNPGGDGGPLLGAGN
ncbi:MAG: hypothetical protein H0X17_12045, partial [Deltaproteobacteria bacterium]|nr:hypothetical protein [Deltaproteobacteria bacterium]